MTQPFESQRGQAQPKDDGIEYTPSRLTDFSKLRIVDGVIEYKLYAQDGSFIPMTISDSYPHRIFVSWVQSHDRYTNAGDAA
jgi:hypothetical protein